MSRRISLRFGRLNGMVKLESLEDRGQRERARVIRAAGESRATLSGGDRGANRVSGGGKWAGNI